VGDEIELAAKAIGESVGAIAEQSGALGPVREVSDWITSFIHYSRQPALARRMMKAAEKVRATGIPPRAIGDKQLRAILEGASLEDEPSMQERWENLLAHALTDEDAGMPPSFPAILTELEPAEAQMLDEFVGRHAQAPFMVYFISGAQARHWDNMFRLRLLEKLPRESLFGGQPPLPSSDQPVVVTQLGYEFVTACREPEPACNDAGS
jgi:hypothetical protein